MIPLTSLDAEAREPPSPGSSPFFSLPPSPAPTCLIQRVSLPWPCETTANWAGGSRLQRPSEEVLENVDQQRGGEQAERERAWGPFSSCERRPSGKWETWNRCQRQRGTQSPPSPSQAQATTLDPWGPEPPQHPQSSWHKSQWRGSEAATGVQVHARHFLAVGPQASDLTSLVRWCLHRERGVN